VKISRTKNRHEKTDMEHLTTDISTDICPILFAPKHHCELAEEGITYLWGASKRIYRRQPLSAKPSFQKHSKNCEDLP
jgi:hypothetical protein